jgi:DNA-directed RNA polymerase subunit RPC12/RpoP
MVAKYKCEECGKKWKSKNSSGSAKQCLTCMGPYIEPYKMKPLKLDKEKVRQYSVGTTACPWNVQYISKWNALNLVTKECSLALLSCL